MRHLLVASLLVLAGCSTHKAASHDPHPEVTLASSNGAGHCSSSAVKNADLASAEGKSCHMKKVEMASTEGKQCSSKKAEMASAEGKAGCHGSTAVLASAETTTAKSHEHCGDCPKLADGSCDHEAGAKAGRECCKGELAKAASN